VDQPAVQPKATGPVAIPGALKPVAPAKAPELPKAPGSAPAPSLPSAQNPGDAVRRYHAAITQKRWDDAWDCLSNAGKEDEGSREKWQSSFDDTVSTEAVNVVAPPNNGDRATIYCEVWYRNVGDAPGSHRSANHQYSLSHQGDVWRIDHHGRAR